jgi:L-iditol 2-dehydrogenase
MRAAVYYRNDDLRITEMPKPKVGPGEALLTVFMCGICGSDVMEWYRIKKAPRVLGHEVVGKIHDIGEAVEGHQIGERVFVSHHVPCDSCFYCLRGEHTACETLHNTNLDPGGFAEYTRVPCINVRKGLFPLPNDVTDEEGVFVEPLGCVVRAQEKLGIDPGSAVLVLGSGVSGILHIQLAKSLGASPIIATDIDENRMKYAERFGADAVINAHDDVPQIVMEHNDGRAPERVVVSTAALPAIKQGLQSIDDGGKVLLFAPPPPDVSFKINLNMLWSNQLTITTSYAASPQDLMRSLEFIRTKKVSVENMVTHKLGLEDINVGFKMVEQGGKPLKVIIEPHR